MMLVKIVIMYATQEEEAKRLWRDGCRKSTDAASTCDKMYLRQTAKVSRSILLLSDAALLLLLLLTRFLSCK